MENNEGNKKVVKRQISIITVFLLVFLIMIIIFVVKGNIKNTNTLQSEYLPVTSVSINPDKKPVGLTSTGALRQSGRNLTAKVGEKVAFLFKAPKRTLRGKQCEHQLAVYYPSDYCDMSLIDNSENNLVGNPTYTAREIDELRILDTTFEALKPGISEEVIVCYFANFGIVFTSPNVTTAYVKCWCGKQSIVNKDVTWYRYNDVFGLKVNADYKIVYDANVDKNEEAYIQNMPNSEINTVSETSAKFNISNSIPKRAGYKFLCWSEENNTSGKEYKPGEEITLNWKDMEVLIIQ